MGLLRKQRGGEAAALSPAGRWTLAQDERGGQPLILRFNEEAELAGKAGWPVRASVVVRFRDPQPNGLPGPEDMGSLELVEDAVGASLAEDDRGVLAFVVTTGGMREFVSYVSDDGAAAALHEAAREAADVRQVQGYAEWDPAWSSYDQFRPGSG